MSIRDQLDMDIQAFFNNIEAQLPEARKKTLLMLIDKYTHLFTTPVLLDKNDFEMVKNFAHTFIMDKSFPKKIGPNKREISISEARILSIIEGTITMLNSKECLKKFPKFDYRD